jgi:tetratricopeptide (TPR) repeat protein
MSERPGHRAPQDRPGRAHRAWAVAVVALALAGFVFLSALDPGSRRAHPDARIQFYKLRLGGPATYPAYAQLGLAYLQKARLTGSAGDYAEAERHLLQSLGYQRSFEALHGLAALHLARHEFREALSRAQESAAALPSHVETQGLLFDAHLALGDTAKAAEIAERMMQEQTGFESLSRLAALRESQGEYVDALPLMGQACLQAEAEQRDADVLAWCQVRVGAIYLAKCDAVQAGHRYERALLLVPDFAFAREHLAELNAAQGNLAEAIALYREVLAESPHPEYRLALADVLALTGNSEEAARERRIAAGELRRSAESSRADWRPLALLLLEDPATEEEGLRWAERDWENRRDRFAADTLAWAYLRNQRPKDAWRILKPVVGPETSGSGEPLLLLHAAQIQSARRRPADARRSLKKALACPVRLTPAEQLLARQTQAQLR